MNSITLYHGSDHKVETPTHGKGKSNNDYGSGFYTTEDMDKADIWAFLMTADTFKQPYRNSYKLNTEGLKILNLKDYGVLAWISEVIYNRGIGVNSEDYGNVANMFCEKYRVDLGDADIIVGYRADDSYFAIVESFLGGSITAEEVVQYFYVGHLGEQVFIKSKKAFNNITFIGCKKLSKNDKRMQTALNKDSTARKQVQSALKDRKEQIVLGRINMLNKPITIGDCIKKDYIYDRVKNKYIVAQPICNSENNSLNSLSQAKEEIGNIF